MADKAENKSELELFESMYGDFPDDKTKRTLKKLLRIQKELKKEDGGKGSELKTSAALINEGVNVDTLERLRAIINEKKENDQS